MKNLDRARTALAHLPPAIAGSDGSGATFRAACLLVRFGLGDGDAMSLLREWNGTHCQPPWSERELAHKLSDARKVAVPGRTQYRPPQTSSQVTHWHVDRKPTPHTGRPQPITIPEASRGSR
jgi:hypothetical protein